MASHRVLIAAGLLALAAVLVSVTAAEAATFASSVVSYQQGGWVPSVYGSDPPIYFSSPSAALGSPDGLSADAFGGTNVLSPFSPGCQPNQIVAIGEGGQLTLKLPNYALAGSGPTIGVISNVFLSDTWQQVGGVWVAYGTATNPVTATGGGSGGVEVSKDGVAWSSLGTVTFDMPANFYTDVGPYSPTAGSQLTDFGKPFAPGGGLADFNGKTYPEILGLLDGSGGGQWLDFSATGLDEIAYIRFTVPDDGDVTTDNYLVIDAVSIANSAVGVPAPEPASLALMAVGAGALFAARRLRLRRRPG